MSKILNLTIEVAGCPTSCLHCGARGGYYKAMPLTDIAWVLEQTRRFCSETNLSFSSYPMHEVLAHPEVPEVLKLFKESPSDDDWFEPIATTGTPLARRDDWRDILKMAGTLGTTTFWFAFHGVGGVHDRIVNRVGAYSEVCVATERVRSMGFRCGCNVFMTKENVQEFDQLEETLQAIGIEEMSWEVAVYFPTARVRRYESLRPEEDDLLPLSDRIGRLTRFKKDRWGNLEAYTEAAYVKKALDSDGEGDQEWIFGNSTNPEIIQLVCRNNLDVHSGNAGLYGHLHGNLKEDGTDQVFQNAVEYGMCPEESLYFSVDAIPSVCEVARRFGNLEGKKVHFHPASMRWRWLDLALEAHRRY